MGGRGERPPSPAPRMTGAGEPRREEPPPCAGLRSRESGAPSAGGWERAERGRGAAARPATGPPPRRKGPLYGMWLVTFLLLLDSLHKGETRAAGGWAVEAAGPGCARLEARCGARWAPGARVSDPLGCMALGGLRAGAVPREGSGESQPGTACQPPCACRLGARPWGAVAKEPLIFPPQPGLSSALPPPQPLARSGGLLELGPRGAL